jgi:hypothetical protein
MAATARLIVMMEESEKAALDAEAESAKVSTAEFVRRRLFGRREPEEQAFLEILAALKPLVRDACRTIERNLADIRTLRESSAELDAQAAERARGELSRAELSSIADHLHLTPVSPAARRQRTRRT